MQNMRRGAIVDLFDHEHRKFDLLELHQMNDYQEGRHTLEQMEPLAQHTDQ